MREKHHLLIRLTHWMNVPVLLLMIWSGLLIYWANDVYIKIPEDIGPFQIHHRLAEGMAWHFFLMWFLVINGLLYIGSLFLTGEIKELLPYRGILRDSIHYTLYDLHLSKRVQDWRGKYNPAQRLGYFSAILMVIGSVVTGLVIYKPVQLHFLATLLGGYRAARFEHFVCMTGLSIFIVIHLIQVARAGWNNFRAMVAGYEVER
jgi:thiosulfate reductase cytochrome b subunit